MAEGFAAVPNTPYFDNADANAKCQSAVVKMCRISCADVQCARRTAVTDLKENVVGSRPRVLAIWLMRNVLATLDREGMTVAGCHLQLAIDVASGKVPMSDGFSDLEADKQLNVQLERLLGLNASP